MYEYKYFKKGKLSLSCENSRVWPKRCGKPLERVGRKGKTPGTRDNAVLVAVGRFWKTGVRKWLGPRPFAADVRPLVESYLVDPASSHMLVSKIKPCMSKCMPH